MVNTDKKVNEVFKTTDYSKFKTHPENRGVINGHVKEIIDSLKQKGWVNGSYIVVNGKGEVIDGQHRLAAAMSVGVEVHYTIEKTANFDNIQGLNQSQKNWSKGDHISGWVKKGNKNYEILDTFMKKFPMFRLTEALMFLTNSSSGIIKSKFERGEFVVKNVKVAEEWAERITKIQPHFDGYNKSLFVRTMLRLYYNKGKLFNNDEFIHKLTIQPGKLRLSNSVELYTLLVEEIYNFKRRSEDKVNLRF
jgi:hypothetical protein